MYETSVTVQGNVGTAPRHGISRAGDPWTSFRMASTVRRPAVEGWQDGATSWYEVMCYRSLARNVLASLSVGDPGVVHGRLSVRDWEKGERSGTDAHIDADSVGHDLSLGTSTFARRGRRRPSDGPVTPPGEGSAAVGSAGVGSAAVGSVDVTPVRVADDAPADGGEGVVAGSAA